MSDPVQPDGAARLQDWLLIDTPYPGYADAVVVDLMVLAATISGRLLLDDLRASGCGLIIEKPDRTNPPSAYVRPQDPRAAVNGQGSTAVIAYDSHDWPSPAYRDSPLSDVMLFTLLRQALHYVWGISDPAPDPAGELTAEERDEVELYRRERGYV